LRALTPRHRRPPLTAGQILAWADEHHRRTGRWPHSESGPIPGSSGDTWCAVYMALVQGIRGLPGNDTLAKLLARHRGVAHPAEPSTLTVRQILRWADRHRRRTGHWPTPNSGPVAGRRALTWKLINDELTRGLPGLSGGKTLARLLAEQGGAQNLGHLPPLRIDLILEWADRYYTQTGAWPRRDSGPVAGAKDETWLRVDRRLRRGGRGLPGGSSLPRLLAEARGVRNMSAVPPLHVAQILAWARAHRRRTGRWPSAASGPVVGAPGETWNAVNAALAFGKRGLPGGSSLAKLLAGLKRYKGEKTPLVTPRVNLYTKSPGHLRIGSADHQRLMGRLNRIYPLT
jgi:hypothetical protein